MSTEGKITESGELVDPKIFKQASKRVRFKIHLAIYVFAMAILWILHFYLFKATAPAETPVEVADAGGMTYLKFISLVTALWTVLIVFHGLFVYKFNSSLLDKEIKKLKKEIEEKKARREELEAERNNMEE